MEAEVRYAQNVLQPIDEAQQHGQPKGKTVRSGAGGGSAFGGGGFGRQGGKAYQQAPQMPSSGLGLPQKRLKYEAVENAPAAAFTQESVRHHRYIRT
jgi:hypothetical protein